MKSKNKQLSVKQLAFAGITALALTALLYVVKQLTQPENLEEALIECSVDYFESFFDLAKDISGKEQNDLNALDDFAKGYSITMTSYALCTFESIQQFRVEALTDSVQKNLPKRATDRLFENMEDLIKDSDRQSRSMAKQTVRKMLKTALGAAKLPEDQLQLRIDLMNATLDGDTAEIRELGSQLRA